MATETPRGRPPNKQKSVSLKLKLSLRAHNYLNALAKRSMLGVSESDVATQLLVDALHDLQEQNYLNIAVPELSDQKDSDYEPLGEE